MVIFDYTSVHVCTNSSQIFLTTPRKWFDLKYQPYVTQLRMLSLNLFWFIYRVHGILF